MKTPRNVQRAIEKYTLAGCLRACSLNEEYGEGAYAIATLYNVPNVNTVSAADAAINAGRFVFRNGYSQ